MSVAAKILILLAVATPAMAKTSIEPAARKQAVSSEVKSETVKAFAAALKKELQQGADVEKAVEKAQKSRDQLAAWCPSNAALAAVLDTGNFKLYYEILAIRNDYLAQVCIREHDEFKASLKTSFLEDIRNCVQVQNRDASSCVDESAKHQVSELESPKSPARAEVARGSGVIR